MVRTKRNPDTRPGLCGCGWGLGVAYALLLIVNDDCTVLLEGEITINYNAASVSVANRAINDDTAVVVAGVTVNDDTAVVVGGKACVINDDTVVVAAGQACVINDDAAVIEGCLRVYRPDNYENTQHPRLWPL